MRSFRTRHMTCTMRWLLISTAALLFLTPPLFANESQTAAVQQQASDRTEGTLNVRIENLRSTKGTLKISLFNHPQGFPTGGKNALQNRELTIEGPESNVTFDGLPKGIYAISVWHDENTNQKIDTNWFGIPTEGLGVSQNAKGMPGPPQYEDACFELKDESMTIIIHMSYF